MRGMAYAGGRQGQGIFLSKGRTVARDTPETLLPKKSGGEKGVGVLWLIKRAWPP
ncbi:hypothetical protein AA0312_0701 [Acetobacter tropicalis NRIC 0312]|nr:hypothetical protein ATR1_070c0037 [Acetobacter tropicalis]GBR68000.1 hypothetical protein AA0312_0701 [Acetobacter tropicalis NRIC 0312]